jgi:hypothetical protein
MIDDDDDDDDYDDYDDDDKRSGNHRATKSV